MKLSLAALPLGLFITGAVSKNSTTPPDSKSCSKDPAYTGFKDIPGISSLCSNAFRPTTTVDLSVTAYTTSTSTVTVTQYRYTNYDYIPPSPTKRASCATAKALVAVPIVSTKSSADLVLAKSMPLATSAALMPRVQDYKSSSGCPPIKDGISTACSCFFGPGPQQTVTITRAATTRTSYATSTTTTYTYAIRTRTLAEGCSPTSVPIFSLANYAICGSPGLLPGQYEDCPAAVSNSSAAPYTFDALDCCSACANTLDCFQALTNPLSNQCELGIRTAPDGSNKNMTGGCPNDRTTVKFSEPVQPQGPAYYSTGFIAGHCAQGC